MSKFGKVLGGVGKLLGVKDAPALPAPALPAVAAPMLQDNAGADVLIGTDAISQRFNPGKKTARKAIDVLGGLGAGGLNI